MPSSVRAAQASYIVLPETVTDQPTVLSFLTAHFSQIDGEIWRRRILDGKVHWRDGSPIALETKFVPRARVYYYREVEKESLIPFEEAILYRDSQIIIAFKPHFLALNPSGNFINECLVNRLRIKTGIDTIVAAHRLDRATAGIILLSLNPETRHDYHELFKTGKIHKQYQALARLTPELDAAFSGGELQLPLHWTVKKRMVKSVPSFMMKIVEGEPNSHSEISLLQVKQGVGLFSLSPITGRTHQLRVHMQSLGMPLLNDRLYPELQPKSPDDFDRPLRLMARRLSFSDPISGVSLDIECDGFESWMS